MIPTHHQTDPRLPRGAIEARIKAIRARLRVIGKALNATTDADSYKAQELRSERGALMALKAEAEALLTPAPTEPPPALDPRKRAADIAFLRREIREQVSMAEWNARREEASGNFRSARAHRLTIPLLPETVCREYGKPLELLALLDGENQ